MMEVIAMTVIVPVTAYHMPGMTATIGGIEGRTTEEEVVAVRIAGIDSEVPEPVTPVEWAEEVACSAESLPLPVEQDIAQIQVAALPIRSKHIVVARHTHQVVEVDFVCSLVLCISQVQLVSHLVRQEEGLVACLLVAHCLARSCCQQHHCQGYHQFLHNRFVFDVQQSYLSFHGAKIDRM